MISEKLKIAEAISFLLNGGQVGHVESEEMMKAKGEVTFTIRDKDGNVTEEHSLNLVVNVGKAWITSRMIGTAKAVMTHMAIGSGTVAAAAADTAPGTQLARVALTSTTNVTTTTTNDAVQFVATFPATSGTGAVTEAALLNAATGGDMLARTVFPVINKGVDDSLTITWKVTLS